MIILSQIITERQIGTSPCYNCPDRKAGCHSKCEKYAAWKEKANAAADARIRDYNRNAEADAFRIDGIIKAREDVLKRKSKKRRNSK